VRRQKKEPLGATRGQGRWVETETDVSPLNPIIAQPPPNSNVNARIEAAKYGMAVAAEIGDLDAWVNHLWCYCDLWPYVFAAAILEVRQ